MDRKGKSKGNNKRRHLLKPCTMSESKSQKRKRPDATNDEQKRRGSSLRSASADLKVIVGEGDGNQAVFWYISGMLASQSGYVDTLLSTKLPTHRQHSSDPEQDDYMEIAFPDIEPEQWDCMMGFLEDPYSMTVEDVMEMAMLYDKYQFKTGIKICDGVLLHQGLMFDFNDSDHDKLLDGLQKMVYTPFSKVDGYVDIIELSEKTDMKKTFYWGRAWLYFLFDALIIPEANERTDFPLTARHISQLIPTLTRDAKMMEFPEDWDEYLNFEEFKKHYNGSGEEIGFGLKDMLFEFIEAPDSIEITNPLFSDWFITKCEKLFIMKSFVPRNIKYIKVIAPDWAKGDYYHINHPDGCRFQTHNNSILVLQKLEKWVLLNNGDGGSPIYLCPKSEFELLPPQSEWIDFDTGSKAQLMLEYVWK